ncbi:P-type conjugative transfer protein VirB9 [Agrobacterium tumefaciens]|uniref:P-type conjugative transfer protein VirB9 n=1 Tax=Agrobacterium tumefaciens TaxID=358 RepID=UPI001572AA4A|nr:P-type conjugative transfer protein VirB9 [Agrobacterium tumefaciens]
MKSFARALILACSVSLCATYVHALDIPTAGTNDNRIRFVNYSANDVVKVIGRYRASTQIEFDATEEIVHVATGDSVGWEVAPARNILFLKPREKNPPTNLQVVTVRQSGERRVYQFELRATEGDVTANDAYFLVRFRYPTDEANERQRLAALQAAQQRASANKRAVDSTLSLHQSYGARNYRYSAQGSRAIQPDSIYDDGKVTTMRFAGNREIPAIYMVQSDGSETLIPWDARKSGELVVVHGTAKEFRLRRGGDVICIFNEAYDAVGINPGTGTTSASVERAVRPEPRGANR